MTTFSDTTTFKAFQKATGRTPIAVNALEGKSVIRTAESNAFPLIWSGWTPLITQFGSSSREGDVRTNIIDIRFKSPGRNFSPFEIEFRGGDFPVSALGPGAARVEITGNVATEISFRVRSLSVPVTVRVSAQLTRQISR